MKTRFIEERAIEIEAFACPIEKPKNCRTFCWELEKTRE